MSVTLTATLFGRRVVFSEDNLKELKNGLSTTILGNNPVLITPGVTENCFYATWRKRDTQEIPAVQVGRIQKRFAKVAQ